MSEEDLSLAGAPTGRVKAASGFTIAGGLFLALTGLQLIGVTFRDDWMNGAMYLFIGLGALLMGLGPRTFRGRLPAAFAAMALAGLGCLAAGLWFLVTFGSLLSLMNIISVPLLGVAALLQFFALADVRRMSAARQRLADDGLSLGL